MLSDDKTFEPTPFRAANAKNFAEGLRRRGQTAKGLEQDLLTKVPLLYGSPGRLEPDGDPGITLARIHREELVRRNGVGIVHASGERSDVALPFERVIAALASLLVLVFLMAD